MKRTILRKGGYQFELFLRDLEHPKGPSMAVPDQSYTIREILDNFSRGMALPVSHNPVFGNDNIDGEDYEKLKTMDPFQLEMFRQDLKQDIAAKTETIKAIEKEKWDKEVKKQAEKLASEMMKEEERSDDDAPSPKKVRKKPADD